MLQRNFSQTDEKIRTSSVASDKNTHSDKNRDPHSTPKLKIWSRPSVFEVLLVIMALFFITVLSISLISAKVNLTNSQQKLQDVDSRVTKLHNDNGNLRQEIGELQNDNRLQKIAVKDGLSNNNKNIRTVGK